MSERTSYVCTLDPEQVATLRERLIPKGWTFDTVPHAFWRARLDKTTVVAYKSGKLAVQGKGTPEFVQFILEPEILGEARFGYEDVLRVAEAPRAMLEPHAGIDESGKGDYFGPLVVASAFVDESSARALLAGGVTDSKAIRGDRRIAELAEQVRSETRGRFSIVAIGPEAYNRLHTKFRTVNRLLAWGHARALENLLERAPDCPRAISDQFGRARTVTRALMQRGREIELEQKPRAERDIAVAAASVLARAEFVRRLQALSDAAGVGLPKGAGPKVDEVALEFVRRGGIPLLRRFAKLHFRTTEKAVAAAGTTPDG